MKTLPLITAALLGLVGVAVTAQTAAAPGTNTPRIDQRQAKQEQRIDSGVASGQLTTPEAHRLQHEQAHIDKAEDRAKSDGSVTAKERKHLTRMQNHASHDIHHQKHDKQTAVSALGK
jgi:hypothetical protein